MLATDIQNTTEKNRWMLDIDPSDRVVMIIRETQYAIFELNLGQAQDKAEEERIYWKPKDSIEHCKMPGTCIQTRNVLEEKETAVSEQASIKLERNWAHKMKRKHKRQWRRTDRIKVNKYTDHASTFTECSAVSLRHDT